MNIPLLELVTEALPMELVDMCAKELWKDGSGWDFQRILPFVPDTVKLRLTAIVLDNVTRAKDRLPWSGSVDGKFSVKSAYTLLSHASLPQLNWGSFFSRI